jgi:hypothetical protein
MPEIPYTPISKAWLFILQSLIAGCLSCQGTLMLAAEKSSFPERVFFASSLPDRPPILWAEK